MFKLLFPSLYAIHLLFKKVDCVPQMDWNNPKHLKVIEEFKINRK
jgi:hypothetical protein